MLFVLNANDFDVGDVLHIIGLRTGRARMRRSHTIVETTIN